jgi:hypothetical protein
MKLKKEEKLAALTAENDQPMAKWYRLSILSKLKLFLSQSVYL